MTARNGAFIHKIEDVRLSRVMLPPLMIDGQPRNCGFEFTNLRLSHGCSIDIELPQPPQPQEMLHPCIRHAGVIEAQNLQATQFLKML